MLESITIVGFQAHSRLTMEFDPEITTIVGPSDTGKSSVIRALRWCALNRIQPASWDAISRHGVDLTRVSIIPVDGHKVSRIRTKSKNIYKFKGKEFHAIGRNVPEEIQNYLRLDEKINFQFQMDPPYWFSLSPPEVSRELNRIVNLSAIDTSLNFLSKRVRKAESGVGFCIDRVEKSVKNCNSLEWVLEADIQLEELESYHRKIEECESKTESLKRLMFDIQDVKRRQARMLLFTTEIEVLEDLKELLEECENNCDRLEELLDKIEECKELVDLEVPDLSELESLKSRIDESRVRRLGKLIDSIEQEESKLWEARQNLKKEKKTLHEKLRNLKKCPLCGQTINHNH